MTTSEIRETKEILRLHTMRYPLMQPTDLVKLLYQNEFGGGHLIAEKTQCLARLRREYAETERSGAIPLCENIGNGLVRVCLAPLDASVYPLEALNRDFIRSSLLHTGDINRLLEKLELLKTELSSLAVSFTEAELDSYLTSYVRDGCPIVSHSPLYRETYHPAYRVVLKRELSVRQGLKI